MLTNLESEVIIKRTFFKDPIVLKPDEGLQYEINLQDLTITDIKVIKMGEKSADTQLTCVIQTQSLINKQLQSSGSKIFLLKDGFILANDFLNQIEQLITDVLGYYSDEGTWPVVVLMDPEAAKKYEEENDIESANNKADTEKRDLSRGE